MLCQFTYFGDRHYFPTLFPHIVVRDTNNTEIFYTSQVRAGKKEMLDEFAINSLIYNFLQKSDDKFPQSWAAPG